MINGLAVTFQRLLDSIDIHVPELTMVLCLAFSLAERRLHMSAA